MMTFNDRCIYCAQSFLCGDPPHVFHNFGPPRMCGWVGQACRACETIVSTRNECAVLVYSIRGVVVFHSTSPSEPSGGRS